MSVTHKKVDDFYIITMVGNLTLDGINIKAYAEPLLEDEAIQGIGLNFGEVSMIDSSGIGTVVSMIKSLNANNAKLVLFNINRQIRKSFEMVGLLSRLTVCDTEENALNFLRQ